MHSDAAVGQGPPRHQVRARVFISHAGTDLDSGRVAPGGAIAELVHSSLRMLQRDTFIDYASIALGETWRGAIKGAAGGSSVFLALLTPEYLRRRWCLLELQLALAAHAAGAGVTIVPVYLHPITPDDLQQPLSDDVCAALRELEASNGGRVVDERVSFDSACAALAALAEAQGRVDWPSKGSLTQCADKVAAAVAHLVPPLLSVEKGVVGQQRLVAWAREQLRQLSRVGVHGMGGAGKSTLAKLVARAYVEGGTRSCVLEFNLDDSQDNERLQRQALRELTRSDVAERMTRDEMRAKLGKVLETQPVLLVLDNVPSPAAVEAVVQLPTTLHSNARILALGRYRRGLEYVCGGVPDAVLTMQMLTPSDAEELLCQHACLPLKGTTDAQREVIAKALECLTYRAHASAQPSFHPLLTKTVARELGRVSGNPHAQLELLKAHWGRNCTVLEDVINDSLRASFDRLARVKPSLQHLFLDVALALPARVRERREVEEWLSWVWEDRDLTLSDVRNQLGYLVDASLVDLVVVHPAWDEKGSPWFGVQVHDLWRELAQQVADEDVVIGTCRFLMGASPTSSSSGSGLPPKAWCRAPGRREDAQRAVLVGGGLTSLDGSQLQRRASLTVVHLSDSLLERLPCGSMPFTQLLSLDLSGNRALRHMPGQHGDMCLRCAPSSRGCELQMPLLRYLSLYGCLSLEALPALHTLTALRTLDLSWCHGLTALPPTLGQLTGLYTLCLSGCMRLTELPDSLRQLTTLHTLNLRGCKGLTQLPPTLGQLTGLHTLILGGCERLTALPPTLGQLAALHTLDLSGCKGLTELPPTLGQLTGLHTLDLSECAGLTELPPTLGQLTGLHTLDLSWCMGLTELPDSLRQLTGLPTLDLRGCEGLTELPPTLGQLTALHTLNLRGCKGLTQLPPTLGQLTALHTLNLRGCKGLTELPPTLGQLTGLHTLDLSGCQGLTELPPTLGQLTALRTLDLYGCEGLTALPPTLGQLTALHTLNLRLCGKLRELPPTLGQLTALHTLDLIGCLWLTELPPRMRGLKGLSIVGADHLL